MQRQSYSDQSCHFKLPVNAVWKGVWFNNIHQRCLNFLRLQSTFKNDNVLRRLIFDHESGSILVLQLHQRWKTSLTHIGRCEWESLFSIPCHQVLGIRLTRISKNPPGASLWTSVYNRLKEKFSRIPQVQNRWYTQCDISDQNNLALSGSALFFSRISQCYHNTALFCFRQRETSEWRVSHRGPDCLINTDSLWLKLHWHITCWVL